MRSQPTSASVFDLFRIGIGPSSSHTMGPMRTARMFGNELIELQLLTQVQRIQVELVGSLGATGKGHKTDVGVVLGLMGETPETVDPGSVAEIWHACRRMAI